MTTTFTLTTTAVMIMVIMVVAQTEACQLNNDDNATRLQLREYLDDDNVRLVEYYIRVDGYPKRFWQSVGGSRWFRPNSWFRAKDTNSERLLLLFHYYYGLLKPYLRIGTRSLDLHLTANDTGCLRGLSAVELETLMRQYLYFDLKNETERDATEFTDDIRVCSMHVKDYDGWGRLVYHCCSRNNDGHETCSDTSDDAWVWVLRAFIIIVTTLLFLHFPRLIPKGYFVYSFKYYPPDGLTFNVLLTTHPAKYRNSPTTTVLPAARWRKMRKMAGEVGKLQREVVHAVHVKRVSLECGMDRLLSETSSPVSVFRSIFDSLVRCKVRHADPLEDCCNAPLCGELCCSPCPAWHACLRAVRTVVVLLLLALPAVPILYAMVGNGLEYQDLARMFEDRDLKQSYNFYLGHTGGKVVVAVLSGLYVLHMVLVVLDGCHDQNLARAYTELLQVTRRKAKLRDRIRDSQSIVRKAVWPVKRFGVLAIPAGLILLALLPAMLVIYLVVTAPVPKLLVHVVKLLCGKTTGRRKLTKAEMSCWNLVENALFVVTLIAVFAVLTLALNFLVHVVVILLVQLIVDISFVMKFLPAIVLLLVYIRDAFKVVNTTYNSHHTTVLRHVLNVEAEDIKREADKDWPDQENKIFKIVPASAADPKGQHCEEEQEFREKKLFFLKNGALRMRTRSLVLFLDKDDIPYIPKKFLFHTTTMACPGCPGPLEEAYLRAAGRFGRTVVFLLFILLVVMAYADTYYISTTSQFFAVLLTGTIPLVLRYFFLNPGSVTKVDTNTLRFQTQMDDKVESFQQSWELEDVEVDRFSLPFHHDHPQFSDITVKTEGTDQQTMKSSKTLGGAESSAATPQTPQASPPAAPAPVENGFRPSSSTSGPRSGSVNFMPDDQPTMETDPDDLAQYQHFHLALDADPGDQQRDLDLQSGHSTPRPKKERRKKKTTQSPLPLVDDGAEAEDVPHPQHSAKTVGGLAEPLENGRLPKINGVQADLMGNGQAFHTGRKDEWRIELQLDGTVSKPSGVQIQSPANGTVSKTGRGDELRIDLVLDVSQEDVEALYRRPPSSGKPPNIHWNRRSRLVKGERDWTQKQV